jgi:hypothetical protein
VLKDFNMDFRRTQIHHVIILNIYFNQFFTDKKREIL